MPLPSAPAGPATVAGETEGGATGGNRAGSSGGVSGTPGCRRGPTGPQPGYCRSNRRDASRRIQWGFSPVRLAATAGRRRA